MKRKLYKFNSLADFFADIKNEVDSWIFDRNENRDLPKWMGLSLADIHKYKFAYPFGVEKLNQIKAIEAEATIKQKAYSSFDGEEMDIVRFFEHRRYLIQRKKMRKLPKNVEIYVNVTESNVVKYEDMLNKTFTALKVIDTLETLGVRTALKVCYSATRITKSGNASKVPIYLEIMVKDFHHPANLGALCATISPWFYRHWILLWHAGKEITDGGISYPMPIPKDVLTQSAIVIEKETCLTTIEANRFIEETSRKMKHKKQAVW